MDSVERVRPQVALVGSLRASHSGSPSSQGLGRTHTLLLMIIDIQHELAVLDAFFAKQAAWVATEYARVGSAPGATTRSNDQIEEDMCHPQGPGSVQDLLCRMTVNELNALIETSMQHALAKSSGVIQSSGVSNKDKHEFVYSLGRGELERRLDDSGVCIARLPGHVAVQQVREIAEGNKHRERLRPVPTWDKAQRTLVERVSVVPGGSGAAIDGYSLSFEQVFGYLSDARAFVQALA